MSKSSSASGSRSTKTRSLPSGVAAKSITLVTKALSLLMLLVAYYVIAFFVAVQVVPLTMGFVKAGTGVTLDMPIETVLSYWIVPALFLVGLIFALVLVAMRALWHLRIRAVARVARWVSGEETEAVADPARLHAKSVQTPKAAKAS